MSDQQTVEVTSAGKPKKLLIGLTAGRSASMSLARFLDQQEGFNVTHEDMTIHEIPACCRFDMDMARMMGREEEIVGDIGHYWLWYVDRFLWAYPAVKVVYLKRDPEEIAESFWSYYEPVVEAGKLFEHPEQMLRTYPFNTLHPSKEAILRSVQEYQAKADAIWRGWSKKIFVLESKDLSNEERLHELLDFFAVPQEDRVMKTYLTNTREMKQAFMKKFIEGTVDEPYSGDETHGGVDHWQK